MWLLLKRHLFTGRMIYFYLFYFMLTLTVSGYSFFWDTIQLASSHAHYYFDNNLKFSFLPDTIDSGHLPAFGYLLAAVWKLFGKTLLVSHLFMLPFLFGIVYQTYRLCNYYFTNRTLIIMIILLADPTLLTQSTLVSPDIPLMFFALMLLNEILQGGKYLKWIAVIGLSLTSMRGWMAAIILFIFELVLLFSKSKKDFKQFLQIILNYIPGGLIAILFLYLHYRAKGWIIYHQDSPWAGSFEKVDFRGFIYNIGIYAWRLLDFGRFIFWIFALIFLKDIIKRIRTDIKFRNLFFLLLLFLLIFPINVFTHKHLTQHRYFMPAYFVVSLFILYVLEHNRNKVYGYICLLALLLGNFLPYPDKISRGWDSTLAYLPYNQLRKNAIEFIEQNNIPFEQTKSWFPNLASLKKTDLINSCKSFSASPLDSCEYCFYSNVFNDVTEREYSEIVHQWIPIFKGEKTGVKVIIYKRSE